MIGPGQHPSRWPGVPREAACVTEPVHPGLRGLGFGLAAVLAWALYNIGVAQGRADGFSVADLTLLRFLGAVLALAPWVLLRGRRVGGALGAGKILVLLALAGPQFSLLYSFGMPLTRLSHAVVISPGFSMLMATLLATLSTRRMPSAARFAGLGVLMLALMVIAFGRAGAEAGPASTWRGDLIFVLTGSLYGTFTFLLGRWRGDAVTVTWQISVWSLLIVAPAYLLLATPTDHSAAAWLVQLVLQGVLGGGWAIVFYALSIRFLGADRAGIFPALVPAAAVLLSVPVSGVLPSAVELAGTALAACGMMLALKPRKPTV